MLDRIAAEMRTRSLSNAHLVLGTETNPKLPDGVADLVLIANAYHEFSQPVAMMAAVAFWKPRWPVQMSAPWVSM